MSGWIKLHRELLKKAIWTSSTPEQKTIFVTLLLMANHDQTEWEWKGEKYVCKPGQIITSMQRVQEAAGINISRQNVRSAIEKFKKYEFITIESTKLNSLITIINWASYQINNKEGNQQTNQLVTNSQPTGNQRVTTNKNNKNNKKFKNEELPPISPLEGDKQKQPEKKLTRLPEDWQPKQELVDWALGKHPTVDYQFQTELFINHFLGNGKRMLNWDRTWQNWIARSNQFSKPSYKASSRAIVPAEERQGGVLEL